MAGSLLMSRPYEEVTVERFEYRHEIVDINELSTPKFDDRLTTLGRDGYNLVATITHDKHGYSHDVHMIFSRRVDGEG